MPGFGLKLPGLPPRALHAEQIDGGQFGGIHALLLADLRHAGIDIGDIVEELVGEAEIDAGRPRLTASSSAAPVRMPPILAAAP